MKKITFNAPLNHKAYSYEPMQIEVEKVIPLYGKRFEQLRDHPLEDAPEIIENRDLMYMEGGTAHCILFLDANGNDGILVEAEGSDYARKSEFISNARAIIEQSEFTYGERQLHAELKAMADRIAELAHTGQTHFTFEEMLGDGNMKAMMIQAVAEMLDRRDDIAEVQEHDLGIAGQADFKVIAKPTQEMKLYCPLEIQAEPQIYETDWDAPYDDLEVIPSSCACGCEDEINAAIQKYSEPNEKYRGLMIYCDEDSPINEKIISAFPSVEVRNGELVGVLTCQITEPLTDSEMSEFQDWWTGQCSDGWSGGMGGKTGLYLIDMNYPPTLTEKARCITAHQDSGVSKHKGEHSGVLVEDGPRAILNPFKEEVYQNGRRVKEPNEPMFTLTVVDRHGIVHQGRIRRLMPIECWRLQGFTTEQFRKVEAAGLSDAQLYKQAGNAVTVNVVEALARNLLKFDKDMNKTKDIRM